MRALCRNMKILCRNLENTNKSKGNVNEASEKLAKNLLKETFAKIVLDSIIPFSTFCLLKISNLHRISKSNHQKGSL